MPAHDNGARHTPPSKAAEEGVQHGGHDSRVSNARLAEIGVDVRRRRRKLAKNLVRQPFPISTG